MTYSDNNASNSSPALSFETLTNALPTGSPEAGRRLTEALTRRFPKSADEALPSIEYRVGSLRALRPCANLGEAIELSRRDAAAALDAAVADAAVADDADLEPTTDAAPRPNDLSREAVAAKVRARAPKALYLNGEPVLTTPRFWWSLFVRCGLSESVFRYFDPAEVFDRVASVDAGRSIRFAIEGDASRGGARKLLAVTSPNGPILDRSAVAEIIDRYDGHRIAYSGGVLRSMHVPASGDRAIQIGPDEFRQRFQLDVPVDGLGEPRFHVALLRLVCQNGAIGTRSVFRSVVRMGKDPQHSLERALGHFANDDGFSAMRDRFESSQRSWASLREVRLLERQLDTISWGLTDGASTRRAAFRRMVGDYEARYGIASVDALSVKRQRMLQANCRVYDLLNFATEMATHHAPPQAAARLHGWLGSTLTEEYDLENTANDVPEFADVYMTQKWWRN
ncbi:MAG: hypothetical protein RLY21_534 [Planctomycetota bacterium]|jgi:hypothetical protein